VATLAGTTPIRIGDLGLVPLGRIDLAPRRMEAKRAFDILCSAILIALLAPVFAAVALAIYLKDRGPIFYKQIRVGLDNRPFTIWKFRTMVPGAELQNGEHAHDNVGSGLLFKLRDDPRVTAVGVLVRRLSLDELPQLINVLRGDMSLVGPRPLPVDPESFDVVARKRHRVRPGITGSWQVAGANALGYDDMIKLDLAYIATWSFHRDLWLLLRTIPAVLVRRSPY
jgi:lipopolysaccharide/colanic/teichoic acid biosynthesis glycosyltransferase